VLLYYGIYGLCYAIEYIGPQRAFLSIKSRFMNDAP
jgi:hypothetical protein